MIIFEKTGCGGLFESLDGGVVNLYRGVLTYCKNGKEILRITKETVEKKEKKLVQSKLYNWFCWYCKDANTTVTITSRHYLKYIEKDFDWKERYIPSEKDSVVKVEFKVSSDDIDRIVKMRRPKNAVDRDSAEELMLYHTINNAFG